MPIDAVNYTTDTIGTEYNTSSTRNTGQLGKDDFLRLLVTQLQYQDPLSPMDDKEFIAQMAQFSSLEQMQNLNSTYSSMKGLSLVGKYVAANKYDGDSSSVEVVEGLVDSATLSGGKTYLNIGEVTVLVEDVTDVWDLTKLMEETL